MRRHSSHNLVAAHTVIIKGVKLYQNNASLEYSDLDVMQMIGRAVSDPAWPSGCGIPADIVYRDVLNLTRRASLSSCASRS